MFNLDFFISEHITHRKESMFKKDIEINSIELLKNIEGNSVLVIGGAGSIGSSFIKAILPFKPKSLVVVDINENSLAELTRDLRSSSEFRIPDEYLAYPMDFASKVFKKMFLNHHGFDIVANFSAHKHVRSEKDIYSVESLIQNNLLNAKRLLDLLVVFPPKSYFCVSTDKAANPVNIMGASKRIMEDLIFSYSEYFPVKTARFANVAFSNGSLPDGFLSRIQKLQPLSAPSDVKRYFVSPQESGQICMLACILGDNREIFFPKLEKEQMVSFDFIAKELLSSLGYVVDECSSDSEAIMKAVGLKDGSLKYPCHFSKSNTSGEKAFEEFYTVDENVDFNRFNSLGIVINKQLPDINKLGLLFNDLEKLFNDDVATKQKVVDIMTLYLPNFKHIETGLSLDSKM